MGVEVGVHTGCFSERLLETWSGEKLWLVDPWRHLSDYLDIANTSDRGMDRRYRLARRRLSGYSGRVGWMRTTSVLAAKRFARGSCDFVYIDANHGYQHVVADLNAWYPKVRAGGLVSGHDYFNALAGSDLEPSRFGDYAPRLLSSYGVKAAVDEFAARVGVTVMQTEEKFPSWYFLKPASRQ